MTKINTVTVCPQCNATIAGMRVCGKCGYKLDKPTSLLFGTPDYLSSQLREHEKETPAKGLRDEYRKWLIESPYEDKMDALFDAYATLQVATLSDLPGDHLKMLIKLGIRIGKISMSLDEYIKNGGLTHGLSKPAESTGNQQSDDDFGREGDIDTF